MGTGIFHGNRCSREKLWEVREALVISIDVVIPRSLKNSISSGASLATEMISQGPRVQCRAIRYATVVGVSIPRLSGARENIETLQGRLLELHLGRCKSQDILYRVTVSYGLVNAVVVISSVNQLLAGIERVVLYLAALYKTTTNTFKLYGSFLEHRGLHTVKHVY